MPDRVDLLVLRCRGSPVGDSFTAATFALRGIGAEFVYFPDSIDVRELAKRCIVEGTFFALDVR